MLNIDNIDDVGVVDDALNLMIDEYKANTPKSEYKECECIGNFEYENHGKNGSKNIKVN